MDGTNGQQDHSISPSHGTVRQNSLANPFFLRSLGGVSKRKTTLATPFQQASSDAGLLELQHQRRLLELGESAANLPDHLPGGIRSVVGYIDETTLVGGIEFDAAFDHLADQKLLNHQITSQPVHALNDDDVGVVSQEICQGGPVLESAANALLPDETSKGEPVDTTKFLNRFLLAKEAIAVDLTL